MTFVLRVFLFRVCCLDLENILNFKISIIHLAILSLLRGQVIEIRTGTSFGECIGYCLSDLRINPSQSYYRLYGWDLNDDVYLPIEIQNNIDPETWQSLNDSLDIDFFMGLDNVIGCPDCSDGGSEWFEITIDDMIKIVTIEYGSSIEGLDYFIALLRGIRTGYENSQSCYFTPNMGPCDANISRYYFDQEENQCMEFSWGGCEGLVPFETMDECESNCFNDEEESSILTGYLRNIEVSFCMDECSIYYLEDEFGNFISNISNQNNIEFFASYVNRFVQIEGDSIACTECDAINTTSIVISSDCQIPVSCFSDPCFFSNCSSDTSAECIPNYCDGCYADYYNINNGEWIYCVPPSGVIDLTGIDFGDCEMALGIGWINNSCQSISGCGWTVDSVDYSGAFFSTEEECMEATMLDIGYDFPNHFHLYHNYPNPFNPVTTISYNLSEDVLVNISIYNLIGKKVNTLINSQQTAGYKSVRWDGTNEKGLPVSSGIYLYILDAGYFRQTKKMILFK